MATHLDFAEKAGPLSSFAVRVSRRFGEIDSEIVNFISEAAALGVTPASTAAEVIAASGGVYDAALADAVRATVAGIEASRVAVHAARDGMSENAPA